jgi:hypothetical protein
MWGLVDWHTVHVSHCSNGELRNIKGAIFKSAWGENGYIERWQYLLYHSTNRPIG